MTQADNVITIIYHCLAGFTSSVKESADHYGRYISASRRPASAPTASRGPVDLSIFNFLLTTPTARAVEQDSCSTDYADPLDEHDADMVKKRNAPSGGFGAGSSSKMRKTANATKFYAVRKGREPGVYLNYDECQAQTTGFPGAKFKSFLTKEHAWAYVAGNDNPSADNERPKFYAVAVGHVPGIYHTWDEAQPQVTEVAGPKHKRFSTQEAAEEFIRENASPETCRRLGISLEKSQEYTGAAFEPVEASTKKFKAEPAPRPKAAPKAAPRAEPDHENNGNVLKIWTDGSSLANGQAGSRAGLGVYFGPNDERNLAERLPGEPQTNQRAELMAILRALEIASSTQDVEIVSDSQYSIKCVTLWGPGWEQNEWKTAAGGPVKNQDLVRGVLARIKERDAARSKTTFQWVKGHASDLGNQRADGLANEGARKPTVS
ncbi:ribonuclease H1 [Fusarium agapanthi]|uniref:ribonuclease H n=1 Tax=Fusarium agapanthi TaxID=1803897 RepID=A0A9P5E553_9HYPO|nr:ribonuclease H1 [Fusarium agapanthi]